MENFLSPRGLLGLASGLAQFWIRTTIRTQEQLLTLLEGETEESRSIPPPQPPAPGKTNPPDSLNAKMRALLNRALDQSTTSSREELYHHILDQLVADEARIISALSDGSTSVAVNVYDWTRRRTLGRAVLENAALVGRNANVALPQMVPTYVSHLLSLGLVEIGPEDPDLKDDYEILLAESQVLRAINDASHGPLAAKVEKLTLRLSPLGHALWEATSAQEGRP
ncbi:Abi-alpha family protein [Mycobacterium intermedium]|uniref:Abi-alpha family protein n=1 Tax=Mycobacterium intermedium TaxID=28445 RepID=UPI000A5E9245|nr:Abi-alpha family protein [Mycobacterium intermedium]